MAESFKAYLVSKTDDGQKVDLVDLTEADLMEGDVTVRVSHSTLNYKDGLALTGKAPVVRRWPMIPGIDFAGTVDRSEHPEFSPGDPVILTGFGVGEGHYGGFSGLARVSGDWLVPLPDGLRGDQAMAIGTAGFTAMLCVLALERHGIRPGDGDVLVTGAAGGVGSVAVSLLSQLGYRVVAVTGRMEEAGYLVELGASEVIPRDTLSGKLRPLAKEQWMAAVDVAGGAMLAHVLSGIRYGGAVAACGLAAGMDLPASVAPFILRNVTLYGVESVMTPKARRIEAWNRLVRDLPLGLLDAMTQTASMAEVPDLANRIVQGGVRGRTVIKVRD